MSGISNISGMYLPIAVSGSIFSSSAYDPLKKETRKCSYCKSIAKAGENCPNCGSPDIKERKPFSIYQ